MLAHLVEEEIFCSFGMAKSCFLMWGETNPHINSFNEQAVNELRLSVC